MKRLLLIVALCTVAAAMVPRQRRAIDESEIGGLPICHAQTPCGWVFYKAHPDQVVSIKTNNDYCKCASNKECMVDEDDVGAESLIKRCKLPS